LGFDFWFEFKEDLDFELEKTNDPQEMENWIA
jgi:hypothetical protein